MIDLYILYTDSLLDKIFVTHRPMFRSLNIKSPVRSLHYFTALSLANSLIAAEMAACINKRRRKTN